MKPIIGIIVRVEYPGETGKLVLNERYRRTIIKHEKHISGRWCIKSM